MGVLCKKCVIFPFLIPGLSPSSKDSDVNSHLLQSTLPNDLNCNRRFDILFGMLYSYILVATLFSLPALLYCQGQGQESKSESPPLKVASLED